VELQADGRFPPYPPLAAFWTDPDGDPLLIRADGEIAGFVLIDKHAHSGLPCDFNMGEFFVARHYRREGVGRAAALMAMRQRPGLWEIAVARRNVPAQPFWRGVAAELAPGGYEELDRADENWDGPVLRVQVG
jgi:predicted acetyltransferase